MIIRNGDTAQPREGLHPDALVHEDRTPGAELIGTRWRAKDETSASDPWAEVAVTGFFKANDPWGGVQPDDIVFTSAVTFTETRAASPEEFAAAYTRTGESETVASIEAAVKRLEEAAA